MKDQTTQRAKTAYHHGGLREALIKATQQLIEEKGSDQFSVSDACRLAGVSTAAPYKHFKSKDEMVLAAMLEAMARHKAELEEDVAPFAKGSLERIVAMGHNYIGFAQREPEMFRLRFAQCNPEIDPDLHETGESIYAIVQEEVRAALGEAQVSDKVRERSFMLWSFVHGMSYLGMVPEFADKHPETSMDDLLRGIAQRVLMDVDA